MPLSGRRIFPKMPPITVFFLVFFFFFCFETLGMCTAQNTMKQKDLGNNTEHFPLCIEYCL